MEERYRNEENRLVKSILSGDQQAFETLYDKYAPILFGVISKSIPDSKHSEEILQELFVIIWNKIGAYDYTKQYLYMWMHALAKELIVKNVSLRSTYTGSTQTEPVDSYVNVPAIGTGNLAKPSGTAFDLIYFKGYTYEEAARELKIPLASLQINIRMELNYLRGTLTK